jgi:outer membrane protein assembly factor BamB
MPVRGILFTGCVFVALTVTLPGAGQREPTRLPVAKTISDDSKLSERRRILEAKIHFRDLRQARMLDRVAAELKNGKLLNGLRHLQLILNRSDDCFVWHRDSGEPVGLRRTAEEMIAKLPSQGRNTYQKLFGKQADVRVREADLTADVAGYQYVLRRYFHTHAGFLAATRLARLAFDREEYSTVTGLWIRLQNDHVHQNRITPQMKLMLAIAYRHLGDENSANKLKQSLAGHQFRIAGKIMTANDWLLNSVQRRESQNDWRMPLGNPRRNLPVAVSTPFPNPVWTVSSLKTNREQINSLIDKWEQAQSSAAEPQAIANTAIVVKNTVITRDFQGIQALDLQTGKEKWSFANPSSKIKNLLSSVDTSQSLSYLQKGFAENSAMGTLSSDGHFVFAVIGTKWGSALSRNSNPFQRLPPGAPRTAESELRYNRLIALRLHSSDASQIGKFAWLTGGKLSPTVEGSQNLTGHFFLGPPLPIGGKLFVMTELNQRLHLACMNAREGRLLWLQPVAFADRQISRNLTRRYISCTPSYANGIVVCPTKTGFLIGVDAETGSLLWANCCGDNLENESQISRSRKSSPRKGHAGFCPLPQIRNGRVLYLPPLSNNLHCIQLSTGKTLWKSPRNEGEYLAAINDDRVAIVGRRQTRCLTLLNGKELWSTATGAPSGRGIQLKDRILVPLETGLIVSLDLANGHIIGHSGKPNAIFSSFNPNMTEPQDSAENPSVKRPWKPGNLIAANGMILSSEARQLRAFVPAASVLANAEKELRRNPQSLTQRAHVAGIQFMLGKAEASERNLLAVLKSQPTASLKLRTENMLREILYVKLTTKGEKPDQLLIRLQQLARSPNERGRYLIRRAEFELQRNNFDGVLQATQQFATLDLKELFPMPSMKGYSISAASWVPDIIGRMQDRFGPDALKTISARIDNTRQVALASAGTSQLEQFLAAYGRWPQADSAREELTNRFMKQGQFQRAEFLLLTNRTSPIRRTRAIATKRLADLWMHAGLHDRAARLHRELADKYADVILSDGQTTGHQHVAQLPESGSASRAVQRLTPSHWNTNRVVVSQQKWIGTDPYLKSTLGRYRQRFLTRYDSSYHLLDRGYADRKLSVIDRSTAIEVGQINIPARHSYPMLSRNAHVGNYFSLGAIGQIHGVSLLEHSRAKPFWSTRPQGVAARHELMQAGPAGPTFASFQGRGILGVLDPATGKLLWQRNDLHREAGLLSDPYSGLFGDAKALVLFDKNRKSYTLYNTQTGEVIRQGTLQIRLNRVRRIFGRRLSYVSETEPNGDHRFRVWDPLTNRDLLDIPFSGRVHTSTTDQGDLIAIFPNQRLLVFDVRKGKMLLDTKFEARKIENLTHMHAFRRGDHLFINIQRAGLSPEKKKRMRLSFYVSDTFIPAAHIRGDLHAFHLKTGNRLWSREFSQCSVLSLKSCNAPFLVCLSQIGSLGNPFKTSSRSMQIEVVDNQTGRTLGLSRNLFPDRILHDMADPDAKNIRLFGENTTIQIELNQAR